MQFGKLQRLLKRFAVFKNSSCVGEDICCACGAVQIAQFVSLIIDATTEFDVQVTVHNDKFL